MANTTWNPSDKSANITLSNGNLTTVCNSAVDGGVKAVDGHTTGKYYFEVTCTDSAGGDSGVGIASDTATLTVIGSAAANATIVFSSGNLYNNGSFLRTIASLGLSGSTVGLAIDLTNKLSYIQVIGGGHTYNGNGADPSAGTNGQDISAYFTGGRTIFPVVCANNTSVNYTANFGDSAFVGTVPTGYTAGWPSNAVALTSTKYTEVNTFGTDLIILAQFLTEAKLNNTNSFGTDKVNYAFLAQKFIETNTFGSDVLDVIRALNGTLFTDTNLFHNARWTEGPAPAVYGRNIVQRRKEGRRTVDIQTLAPSSTIFRFY